MNRRRRHRKSSFNRASQKINCSWLLLYLPRHIWWAQARAHTDSGIFYKGDNIWIFFLRVSPLNAVFPKLKLYTNGQRNQKQPRSRQTANKETYTNSNTKQFFRTLTCEYIIIFALVPSIPHSSHSHTHRTANNNPIRTNGCEYTKLHIFSV